MGQVSLLQGIYQFVLQYLAIGLALSMFQGTRQLQPAARLGWIPLAAFATSFVLHIAAFIVLKIVLEDELSPAVHRPIIGAVWALASGGIASFWIKPPRAAVLAVIALTFLAYLLFVFTRLAIP